MEGMKMNNELIEKLAKKSKSGNSLEQDQKFAELLLKEVNKVLENVNYGMRFETTRDEFIEAVNERFGT